MKVAKSLFYISLHAAFLLVLIPSSGNSATAIVMSENDIFKLVEANNRIVESQASEIKSQEAKAGHVTRSFLPEATLFAGQESYRYVVDEFKTEPYYGAQIQVNLYNGGRDSITGELNSTRLKGRKASYKVKLFEQVEGARKSFWQALFLKSLIGEYKQMIVLIEKNTKAAMRRIRSGVATNSDKFEFEIRKIEIDQDLRKTQLLLDKELGSLKILTGLERGSIIEFSQKLEHDHNWRKFFAHSEDEHDYLIQPQKIEVQKTKLKSKLSSRAWAPKIDAYGLWVQNNQRKDYDRLDKEDRQQTAIGIKATWSFLYFVEARVEGKSLDALENAKASELAFQKQSLENELHFELQELDLLDGMVHEAEENVARSAKFFKLITKEYQRGVKTSGDMLMATEKLVQSKLRRMTIIKDFQFAKSHVMTKLGK